MENINQKNIQVLLDTFRQNENTAFEYLTDLENQFSQVEPDILAFIPEENRFDRIHNEILALNKKESVSGEPYPLFGLLIGVKDIFHANGFPTQAGSNLPGSEAVCVSTLKNLGASIFGKTVTTEFAYFAPGPTRNPHNPDHTPGGSSSGSAAAVAAGIVPFAFGSQTIGSIIRPASFCGVVGFKPSYNRISTMGVIPLSPSVDTIGFFTSDVPGSKFMAGFLLKNWNPDHKSKSRPVLGITKGPYLGYAKHEMMFHLENVLKVLKRDGYQIEEVPVMDDFEHICHRHNQIVAYESAQVHNAWYADFGNLYNYKTSELINRGQDISISDYNRALDGRLKLREQLTKIMKLHGIDLWLSPPARGAAPLGLESTGDPIMNLPWTHCGYPTLNIPAGFNDQGLPLGLQISASWEKDEDLLSWGTELENVLI